jgi:hypothetical protein
MVLSVSLSLDHNVTTSEPNSLLLSNVDDFKFHADIAEVVQAHDTECRSKRQNSSIPNGHLLEESSVTH